MGYSPWGRPELDTSKRYLRSQVLLRVNYFSKIVLFIVVCAGSSLLVWAFSRVAASWGSSLVVVHRLLVPLASPIVEHGFWGTRALAAAAPRLWSTGSIVAAPGFSCFVACEILPDQRSNPCLLYRQEVLHQGILHQILEGEFLYFIF